MSYRFKWAFQQAVQATLTCTILLLIAAFIFEGAENKTWHRASGICLLLIAVPIAVRLKHFWDIFQIQTVVSEKRGVRLEVGHYTTFMDRFRIEHMGAHTFIGHQGPVPFGNGHIFALLYDNGMLVVANSERQLQQVHSLLREHWPYHPLLDQCEKHQPTMMWTQPKNPDVVEIAA